MDHRRGPRPLLPQSARAVFACHLWATVWAMTPSPEAKYAPIGALRGGLALLILGALMVWGPVDSIPAWLSVGTLFLGGLSVAIAMGIRMLRT